MSFTYGFYNSQNHDRKYDAVQISELFSDLITDGVFQNYDGIFATKPGSGMQVIVQPGKAWFNMTWSKNSTPLPVVIPAADPVRSRIDAIVIEVNSATSVRANSIKVVSGSMSTLPQKPVLTNTETLHQHAIAYVTVPKASTSISASNIEIVVGKSECPFVSGILKTANLDDLYEAWQSDFDAWFTEIKGQLSGDVAGNLQKQISELKSKAEVTDSKVTKLESNVGSIKIQNGEFKSFTYDDFPMFVKSKYPSIPMWYSHKNPSPVSPDHYSPRRSKYAVSPNFKFFAKVVATSEDYSPEICTIDIYHVSDNEHTETVFSQSFSWERPNSADTQFGLHEPVLYLYDTFLICSSARGPIVVTFEPRKNSGKLVWDYSSIETRETYHARMIGDGCVQPWMIDPYIGYGATCVFAYYACDYADFNNQPYEYHIAAYNSITNQVSDVLIFTVRENHRNAIGSILQLGNKVYITADKPHDLLSEFSEYDTQAKSWRKITVPNYSDSMSRIPKAYTDLEDSSKVYLIRYLSNSDLNVKVVDTIKGSVISEYSCTRPFDGTTGSDRCITYRQNKFIAYYRNQYRVINLKTGEKSEVHSCIPGCVSFKWRVSSDEITGVVPSSLVPIVLLPESYHGYFASANNEAGGFGDIVFMGGVK